MIPAYWTVDSTRWDTVINTHNSFPQTPIALVINISNGAGPSANASWTNLINRLQGSGIIILGFVDTNGSTDTTATVNGRSNAWNSFYPQIDGIYFDNIGIQTTNQSFLQTVANHAKTMFDTTVANAKVAANVIEPGGGWSGGAIGVDTFVVWDGGSLDPVDTSYSKYQALDNNNLAVMAHGIPSLNTSWVNQMAQYMGWIYTTTGTGTTPYNSLPGYFADLIQLLDNIGSGSGGGGGGGGTAQDQWGINKIYHTKEGGEEFFMNMEDFLSTFQAGGRIQNFEGENFSKQADGSYQSNGGSEGDLRIEAWSPAHGNTQQRLDARWLNVEHTIYSRNINYGTSADPEPPYAFQLYQKGGHHTGSRHCEGGAYKFRFRAQTDGVTFAKEACHSNYSSNVAETTGNLPGTGGFANGRWHGVKAVQYNIVEDGNTYVRLETYVDPDCSDSNGNLIIRNNWVLASSTVDRGQSGFTTESRPEDCSGCGRTGDTILTTPISVTDSGSPNFNRNLVAYRSDKVTTRIKYWSAREIDPAKKVSDSPPPPPPNTPNDVFGIKKIYPTIANGYEWFMNMSVTNPNVANKFVMDTDALSKNSDGSFKYAGVSPDMWVYQRNGYNPTATASSANDHALLHSRGYMQDTNDWKNIEATIYIRLNNTPTAEGSFQWFARGGRHLDPSPNCEGSALRSSLFNGGETLLFKEQWHIANANNTRGIGMGSLVGKWVGYKFTAVSKLVSGTLVTNQQIWLDPNNDNTWVKYDERTDSGGWGTQGGQCGGAPDQLVSWGGPIVIFDWTSFNDVDFKNMSVREIDPSGIPIGSGPGTNPSLCGS